MSNNVESYEAFITQARSELEKDGAEAEVIDAAVFAMQKAKLLFTGSPMSTILRNEVTGESATRSVDAAGIPLWQVVSPTGERYNSHEPVLLPEGDWKCIYNPEA